MILAIQRTIDIVVGAVTLTILSPLLAAIAISVCIDSRGSPFYHAKRVAKDGRIFYMPKFRTMYAGSDRVSTITAARDPRVTRVGNFLRKTKLDELPQFWNLLTGDLTLIGPRPEAPNIVAMYTDKQKEILHYKAGITGPTQLDFTEIEANCVPEGPRAEQFYIAHVLDQKIAAAVDYERRRTMFSDLVIVCRTVQLVLRSFAK